MSTKPDDSRAIPLCAYAHNHYHEIGRKPFEQKYEIELETEIKRLNAKYLREHPEPKKQRPIKPRLYRKKPIIRGWVVVNPEITLPAVASLEEARVLRAKRGGKIVRCQIRIEGSK